MKKLIAILVAITMLFSMTISIGAVPIESISNNILTLQTNEKIMPSISPQMTGTIIGSKTISTPERNAWVKQTTEILEKSYNQKIINVTEDEDYIFFHYDDTNIPDEELSKDHLAKTAYLKPESVIAYSDIFTDTPTKINYVWGWSKGYYTLDSAAGPWGVTKDVLVTIFGSSDNTVLNIFLNILGISVSSFRASMPVEVQSMAKYYYHNKIGYVEANGYWLPYAYVGSRRGFKCVDGMTYDSYGQPILQEREKTDGKPSNNPINYDTYEIKPHYNDDSWIMEKALYQYKNDAGVYSNVFGTGTNLG